MTETTKPAAQLPVGPYHPAIPISAIDRSRNYRKTYDHQSIAALAESIRHHGLINPVTVVPGVNGKWVLVAGERRLRALEILGQKTTPATSWTDSATAMSLIENLQRQDVDPLEEADGFRVLSEQELWGTSKIAAHVGVTPRYVTRRLRLCALGPEGRNAYRAGAIDAEVGLMVARLPAAVQAAAVEALLLPGAPMRADDARRILQAFMHRLVDAPFDVRSKTLVPVAGTCGDCPKRTGNQPDLFGDLQDGDTCTDQVCYQHKVDAAWALRATAAVGRGLRVMTEDESANVLSYSGDVVESEGYVDADKICPDDPKGRSYRALVQSDLVVLARDIHGRAHELLDRDVLAPALARHGIAPATREGGMPADEWRDQRSTEKAARRRHSALASAVVAALVSARVDSPDEVWRVMIDAAVQQSFNDAVAEVVRRRGWAQKGRSAAQTFAHHAQQLAGDDLPRLLFELFLARVAYGYFGPETELAPMLVRAAKALGVDIRALRRSVEVAAGAAKPKKKRRA